MHELEIIHRDLKPDNLVFEKKDQLESLKICDFGLATFKNVPKYIYPKCGTPGYVAPEVLNLTNEFHRYDEVCDIFSVGCIFYKL